MGVSNRDKAIAKTGAPIFLCQRANNPAVITQKMHSIFWVWVLSATPRNSWVFGGKKCIKKTKVFSQHFFSKNQNFYFL